VSMCRAASNTWTILPMLAGRPIVRSEKTAAASDGR
jgi:hypothetical protein